MTKIRKYRKRRKSRKTKRRRRTKRRRNSRKGGLSRWFAEEWVDVCTGRPCGRRKGSKRKMPYCRPKRRITKGTPRTRRSLSKKKIKEMCRKKRRKPKSRMKKV